MKWIGAKNEKWVYGFRFWALIIFVLSLKKQKSGFRKMFCKDLVNVCAFSDEFSRHDLESFGV